jgi:hypothetical protein
MIKFTTALNQTRLEFRLPANKVERRNYAQFVGQTLVCPDWLSHAAGQTKAQIHGSGMGQTEFAQFSLAFQGTLWEKRLSAASIQGETKTTLS